MEQNMSETGFEALEGLIDYIDVLVESYPEPISRKQLAERAGVSKPAVTKVSDRLLGLCDYNKLIFGKKLVLRTDGVVTKLFLLYVSKLKPARILNSRYGLAVLRKIGIHSFISERFPEYGHYFDESDTETIVRILLHNLDRLKIEDKIRASVEGVRNKAVSVSLNYVSAIAVLADQFDLPIKTKEDLAAVLRIRDKTFLLSKCVILNQIRKASIMNGLSAADKTKYMDVYSGTVDYYLKKIIAVFTDFVEHVAQNRGIEFKDYYRKIGCFYSL
jgi:hypothetical protein